MKKTAIILGLMMCSLTQSHAQDSKGYIGVSLGPSIPLGDFASTDSDNEDAGWARSGAIFDISFAYKLGSGNFGITALLRGQANALDVVAFSQELANEYPGVTWTVESDGWSAGGLMFGGFGSFPISEKTSFDTRVMLGFLNASNPAMTLTASGPGGNAWVKQSSVSSSAFAYLIGAGFNFSIGRRLCFLTSFDYMGAKPEFSNVEVTASDGSREFDTFSQKMGTFNLGVGLAIRI